MDADKRTEQQVEKPTEQLQSVFATQEELKFMRKKSTDELILRLMKVAMEKTKYD